MKEEKNNEKKNIQNIEKPKKKNKIEEQRWQNGKKLKIYCTYFVSDCYWS